MCNLYNHQCNPVIPKGFYKCKSCNGHGVLLSSPHYRQKYILAWVCAICNGNGYVDWLQNIRVHTPMRSSAYVHIPFKCPADKNCQFIKNEIRKLNKQKKRKKLERKL